MIIVPASDTTLNAPVTIRPPGSPTSLPPRCVAHEAPFEITSAFGVRRRITEGLCLQQRSRCRTDAVSRMERRPRAVYKWTYGRICRRNGDDEINTRNTGWLYRTAQSTTLQKECAHTRAWICASPTGTSCTTLSRAAQDKTLNLHSTVFRHAEPPPPSFPFISPPPPPTLRLLRASFLILSAAYNLSPSFSRSVSFLSPRLKAAHNSRSQFSISADFSIRLRGAAVLTRGTRQFLREFLLPPVLVYQHRDVPARRYPELKSAGVPLLFLSLLATSSFSHVRPTKSSRCDAASKKKSNVLKEVPFSERERNEKERILF